MAGPKVGSRCQHNDIALIDDLPIRVEADETIVVSHIDARYFVFLVELPLQASSRTLQAVVKGIRHRHQFHAGVCVQRLRRSTGSSPAASDKANL